MAEMYGFTPGEKVWVRGDSGYVEATVAPAERQTAYQAKPRPAHQSGKLVILRKPTGIIGKPIHVSYLFHNTMAMQTYVAARQAEQQALAAARRYCTVEGLVWEGKRCQQSPPWQTYKICWTALQVAEDDLRNQILSAKV